MNIQMNSAASSMRELQKKVDVIANNISNVNTTGYKRQEANFSDALASSMEKQAGQQYEVGRQTHEGLRVGSGAVLSQATLRTEQGSAVRTDRALDFMINGNSGFFRVESGGNTFYTKDGSFQVQPILNSNEVSLVTANGDAVLDGNNLPIRFDRNYNAITVSDRGTLEVTFKDPARPPVQFQLSLAKITRPDLLEQAGGNRYRLPGTEAEQAAAGALQIFGQAAQNDGSISVTQGALESSNVDLTEEMTELISTQRLIQSQGRAISFADDMMGLVNTMKG